MKHLSWLLLLLALGSAAAQDPVPAPLPAPKCTSDVKQPDYSKAWDMVFISEGYQHMEEDAFLEHARLMARKLRFGNTSAPLRKAYTYNFHFVFAPSREGVSWKPGSKPGDTAIKAYTDSDGVLITDDALADALAIEHAPDVDSIVVVAQFKPRSAYDISTWTPEMRKIVEKPDHVRANADMPSDGKRVRQPSVDPDAFIHELGHAIFGLGDEYGEYEGAIPASGHWEIALTPNLTTDSTGARWKHIIDSVFEGGGYYATGVYRPERECRMRESRMKKFCAVCTHAIEGVSSVEVPSEVVITSPRPEEVVKPALLDPTVTVSWTDEESPLYYAIELYASKDLALTPDDATPLWDDYLEGHLRSFKVPVSLTQQGALTVRIFPTNYLDQGPEPSEVEFVLETPGSNGAPVPAVTGVSEAVQNQ